MRQAQPRAGATRENRNDLAPYNTVCQGARPVGFIDWDVAAPGPRLWDVAHAVWRFTPVGVAAPVDVAEQARRARLFCDAYGLTDRGDLVETILWRQRVLHDTIRTWAASGDPAFVAMWGTSHSEAPLRDGAFLQEHRAVFESAL